MMEKKKKPINKVRASRDGHEFHEAWAARKALQLIFPSDELVGIAVEGPSPKDEKTASAASVEVADLVFFYGKKSSFDGAAVEVLGGIDYQPIRIHGQIKSTGSKLSW